MAYLYLGIAIITEVIATSFLKKAEGFTVVIPSFIVVSGYACAFYFLSLTLKTVPIGIAYAIWAGFGMVLIVIVGLVFYEQKLDLAAFLGIALIISGVVIINMFSTTPIH